MNLLDQSERYDKVTACIQHDDKNIKGFFDQYGWLSNFYEASVIHDHIKYYSTEAAYQAAKVLHPRNRKDFTCLSAAQAKRLGKSVTLRYDWDKVKERVMYEVCLFKFTAHKYLQAELLATGDKYLEETNYWGDTYWGVCNGEGQNKLGETLMKIRSELNQL